MALPHLYTARRKQQQDDSHLNWVKHASRLNSAKVSVNKHCSWESSDSFNASMQAWAKKQDEDNKINNLELRRIRLRKLIIAEKEMYQRELKNYPNDKRLPLHLLKEKAESLKSSREEERKEIAERKLYEHWKENNPELRQIESARLNDHVIDTWREQVDLDKKLKDKEDFIRHEEEKKRNEAIQKSLKDAKDEVVRKKKSDMEFAKSLKLQMENIKQREIEAKLLKKNEEKLLKERLELESLKQKQKEVEKEREKNELGRILKRQHAAALKRKSRVIQKELEQDKIFMELLEKEEEKRLNVVKEKRKQAQTDAKWMKEVLERQLQEEREREAALNLLYQEEAENQWAQRERQWDLERLARKKLISEVLAERDKQIEERLQIIQDRQQETVEEREKMLEELEELRNLKIAEELEKKEQIKNTRMEIDNQIIEKRALGELENKENYDQIKQDQLAEEVYKDLLHNETRQLKQEPFTPKHHAKVKQAWN